MRARHLAILLAAMILVGCPKLPAVSPVGGDPGTTQKADSQFTRTSIVGQVDMSAFRVQASVPEVATGATISLIDGDNGLTLGTTVSKPDGTFALIFSNGFKPTANKVYYLEAIKGLKAGTDLPNRVGSPLARVRTLIAFQSTGWVSIGSSVPGNPISITLTTTALSVMASLRSTTARPVPLLELLGSLGAPSDPATFTKAAQTGLSLTSLANVVNLVRYSLQERDEDPLRSVVLDLTDSTLDTFVLPDMPFTVSYLDPPAAAIGEELFVVGDNFDPLPANNVVTFAGSGNTRIPAPVTSVTLGRTRLRVVVPSGATNGLVTVQVDNLQLNGPWFSLASRDGHRIVDDSGNLYVSNSAYGTVSKITPDGVTLPVITGLSSPRGLTLGTDGTLYVISGSEIRNYSTAGALIRTYASGASGAWGLAFSPSGELFVSLESANRIAKVVSGALTDVSSSGLLSKPRGLSFGPDGKLYVANFGNDTISQIDPVSGATVLYKSGFSQPWSLAFDTFGAMYVTNNAGNSVYRVGTDGVVKPFASVQSPGGIDADPSGYLYVADNASNRVYRIDTAGNSRILAEGVSYPKGIAIAADGSYYVANSQNNTVIRVGADGTVATFARGFNDPCGLALDETHGYLYVANFGNGTVSRVSLADGSVTTYLRNLYTVSGLAYLSDRLYVYQGVSSDGNGTYSRMPDVLEYDVTTSPATQTRKIRSNLRNGLGIGVDPTSGAIYVTHNLENFVTRLEATGRLTRFASTAPSPVDVTVDSAGLVYVACQGTGTGDDAIQVFNPDGTPRTTLSGLDVDRPSAIDFDGTAVYFANSSTGAAGSGSLKRVSPADQSVTGVATGLTNPTGMCFYNHVCYVAGNGQLLHVDSYDTAPVPPALAFTAGGILDIGVDSTNGTLFPLFGGSIKQTNSSGNPLNTWSINLLDDRRLTPIKGGGGFYISSAAALIYQTPWTGGSGNRSFKSGGSLNSYADPMIAAGTDALGKKWLLVPRGPTWEGGLSKISLEPSSSDEYFVADGWDGNTVHGAAFDSSTGKAWAVSSNNARILRYKADHSGTEVNSGYDNSYTGFGACAANGSVYVTVYSHHRVDRMDGTNTRTIQPFGLGGPEL